MMKRLRALFYYLHIGKYKNSKLQILEKILYKWSLLFYRISPVSKEDGIPRKFAFKAEHQNMRTYYFAADSQTNMIQWMNALSLASILQSDKR